MIPLLIRLVLSAPRSTPILLLLLLPFLCIHILLSIRITNKFRRSEVLRSLGIYHDRVKIVGFFHPYWSVGHFIYWHEAQA